MAIDFMTMPLSRYLSGAYVTPAMAYAWAQGMAYFVVGPEGRRDLPPGQPFGGPDADANRERFVPMLVDDLRSLPALAASMWDEASAAEPTFHRVDADSYASLLEEASSRAKRPALLGLLGRRRPEAAHLAATVFLPVAFDAPFAMPVVFERVAGSAPLALGELEAGHWTPASSSARGTLLAALRDAVRLRLPMVVDA
jgi:hypothetical protein